MDKEIQLKLIDMAWSSVQSLQPSRELEGNDWLTAKAQLFDLIYKRLCQTVAEGGQAKAKQTRSPATKK